MRVKWKKIKWVFLVTFGLFLISSNLFSFEVTVVGEGPTKQAAINDALRSAIEQALGTYVASSTKVSMGQLDYDRIISESAGYVKSYNVLAAGKDPIEDIYKVKIRATIDDYKIKNLVQEFESNPKFQKAFQEATFESRRVVVLYNRRTRRDLPYDSKAVQTVMDLIEDKLAGMGFRVFLPDQLKRIKTRVTDLALDEETAINIARQEDGDAVVLVTIDAGIRPTSDGYNIVYTTLSLKAFDVTTGELFANVQKRAKTIARGGGYGIADGAARAAIKVGRKATSALVAKIVRRFSTKRSKFVVLIFRDVPQSVQDKIEDILDNLDWKYRIARQSGTYMEIEVFSESDPTSVRKVFRRAIRKEGLSLSQVEMKGSRIVFSGEQF